MLAAIFDGKGPGLVVGSARMPREGGVYEAVRALFALEVLTLDCFMMALPPPASLMPPASRTRS